MEHYSCCSSHLECQTTGICKYGNGVDEQEGISCDLYKSTISTSFPVLYKMKQKGWVTVENNYLTELGEKGMFRNWDTLSDYVIILNIIYVLQMKARNSRIDPADILAIAKIMKGDVKKWAE